MSELGHRVRKIIHRFPAIYRLCLRIVRDGGKLSYIFLDKREGYSSKIKDLKNTHAGERCFIVGNGPSLRTEDLDLLINEDCFATNKIYRIFDQTNWRPKYYVVADWSGLEDDQVDRLDDVEIAFLGDHFYRLHNVKKKNALVFYGKRLLDTKLQSFQFSSDVSKEVVLGATVTYACFQIAAYMGYKEIYLLGIDHNYAYIVNQMGEIVRNEKVEASHFFKENASNAYADIIGMNNAYIAANKYFSDSNIKVFNATRGGALELFPRVDFDSIVKRINS